MGRAFICYAHEDLDWAIRLYDGLVRRGANPWLDKKDLLPGQDWEATVRKVIQESSHFIAIISRHWKRRGFMRKEVRLAIENLDEIPPNQIYIIPIRLDSTKPDHPKLARLHWVDLFDSYEIGLASISESLGLARNLHADDRLTQIRQRMHTVFTPTSPVGERRLLYGRKKELQLIEQASRTPGQCAAIFGDLNVGKTSLSKVVERYTPGSFYRPISRRDSFQSCARAILSSYGLASPAGDDFGGADFAELVTDQKAMIILDDFEILTQRGRRSFCEAIRNLADRRSRTTLVFVGTALSAQQLIPDQRILGMYVMPIGIKPLKKSALAEILEAGFARIGHIKIKPEARDYILEKSGFSPNHVHKYCINSTYALLERIEAGEKNEYVIGIDECLLGESFDPQVG